MPIVARWLSTYACIEHVAKMYNCSVQCSVFTISFRCFFLFFSLSYVSVLYLLWRINNYLLTIIFPSNSQCSSHRSVRRSLQPLPGTILNMLLYCSYHIAVILTLPLALPTILGSLTLLLLIFCISFQKGLSSFSLSPSASLSATIVFLLFLHPLSAHNLNHDSPEFRADQACFHGKASFEKMTWLVFEIRLPLRT